MASVPPGPFSGAVIFLVHGTFAKRALWPYPDQPPAAAIVDAMPGAIVRRFRWSGTNSHEARAAAGRALAERFEQSLADGAERLYAVGHSHGGNVILKALECDRLAGRVRGIVFLGTPFLCASERRTGLLVANFLLAATFVLAFGGMVAAPRLEAWIGMTAAVTAMLLAILVSGILYLFRDALRRKLNIRIAKARKARIALVSTPTPACPVLVATTPLDEAGHYLSLLTRLAAEPWRMIGPMAAAVGPLIIGAIFCSILIDLFGIPVDSIARAMVAWVLWALFAGLFFLALPLAVVVALLNRFSYGGMDTAASIAVRVAPQPLPPWSDLAGSSRESFEPRVARLRSWLERRAHHSFFYEDPRVLGRVAGWLAQVDARPATAAPLARAKAIPAGRDDVARGWYMWPAYLLLLAFIVVAVAERIAG